MYFHATFNVILLHQNPSLNNCFLVYLKPNILEDNV